MKLIKLFIIFIYLPAQAVEISDSVKLSDSQSKILYLSIVTEKKPISTTSTDIIEKKNNYSQVLSKKGLKISIELIDKHNYRAFFREKQLEGVVCIESWPAFYQVAERRNGGDYSCEVDYQQLDKLSGLWSSQ